jgi:biopolymer transport protein ExbB
VLTLLERSARVRRGRVVPRAFRDRFRARLAEGKLDWAKGLDFCELNPSPAARVALAALRRWGRPAPDLDRAVALARQSESDRMRRHVGTLRRIAALSPLIGLLGSLVSASRALAALPPGAAWGPPVASALAPLTAGVGLAILALVAYDGLMGRVETLSSELDRLGAEVVDALAPLITHAPASSRERTASTGHQVRVEPAARPRAPHSVRVEIPERFAREIDRDVEV